MKKLYFLLFTFIIGQNANGQIVSDFEDHGLAIDTFWNGSDGSGGFDDEGHFFHTDFIGGFWSGGWALSTMRDTLTSDYTNLYSAITGEGFNSKTYTVGQNHSRMVLRKDDYLKSLYITNSTYAYKSMLNGDQFAKKFGGKSGDDPDFFLLNFIPYVNGVLDTNLTTEFYLADYRFEDNSKDYIVKEWVKVDFLLSADSIELVLTSSDTSQWGFNTPAFFCMDYLDANLNLATKNTKSPPFSVFPNPTLGYVSIEIKDIKDQLASWNLFDVKGVSLVKGLIKGSKIVDLSQLERGVYFLQLENSYGITTKRIIKQ